MEPKITNEGILHLDIAGIIDNLPNEERVSIIRMLTLEESFLDDTVSCIVSGRTKDGDWWWSDHLIRVKRRLFPMLPVLAQNTIKSLEDSLAQCERLRTEDRHKYITLENKLYEAQAEVRNLRAALSTIEELGDGASEANQREEE